MKRGKVAGIAVVALSLLIGSAACSSGGTSSPSGKDAGGKQAGVNPLNGRGDLPKDFPLPSDVSTMQSVTIGPRISVTMRLTEGAQDYDFWVRKLPEAGYTIRQTTKTADGGLLSFNGNGYRNGEVSVRNGAGAIIMTK